MNERSRPACLALVVSGGLFGGMACSSGAGCKTVAPTHQAVDPVDPADPPTVMTRSLTIDDAIAELWPAVRGVEQQAATEEEKHALSGLIERLWRGVTATSSPETAQLGELAHQAGMTLALWTIDRRRFWIVREAQSRRVGRGIYIVRAEPSSPGPQVLFEAPHVYFDTRTQLIAAGAIFANEQAPALRGLFTNSLHRYQQTADRRERRAGNPADVSHNPSHLFQVATAAVVATGGVTIVQLHGFDDDSRGDDRTAGAHVVVSATRRDGSTPQSTAVARALADSLHVVVARFPEDISALGGTTNAQAKLVEGSTGSHFVHVEIAAELRRSLSSDRARLAALGKAIVDALATGSP